MQCPYCGSDSQVVDSRTTTDAVRRRRICNACKRRFTTYEKTGAPGLKVMKRNGKTEQFDADKLQRVLRRVCRHRSNVGDDDIRRIVRDIEGRLIDERVKTVRSGRIARLALDRLVELDRVSHNRLAANYIDESGQLRTMPRPADDDPSQLGLFEGESERADDDG